MYGVRHERGRSGIVPRFPCSSHIDSSSSSSNSSNNNNNNNNNNIITVMMMRLMMFMKKKKKKMMVMMIIIITTTTTIIIITTTIKNTRIERRNSRFLQSAHCAANCLQYVLSSGQGAIMCKSRATHRTFITLYVESSTQLPPINCYVVYAHRQTLTWIHIFNKRKMRRNLP